MDGLDITIPKTPAPQQPQGLPTNRSRWPDTAVAAFKDVLFELNAWSRACGEPGADNVWIAETAVRQAW